jgi:hypothetical protein
VAPHVPIARIDNWLSSDDSFVEIPFFTGFWALGARNGLRKCRLLG